MWPTRLSASDRKDSIIKWFLNDWFVVIEQFHYIYLYFKKLKRKFDKPEIVISTK